MNSDSDERDRLEQLYQTQKAVAELLNRALPLLAENFLDAKSGWIKRAKSTEPTGESNATCTAFSLYYLIRAGLLNTLPNHVRSAMSVKQCEQALSVLESQIVASHLANEPASTTTGKLPNQYNSPIYSTGLLKAAGFFGRKLTPESIKACRQITEFIVKETWQHRRGYLTKLVDPSRPSAYFSYWGCAALREWRSLGSDPVDNLDDTIDLVCRWSESQIARGVAFHEAKVLSEFDIIEVLYAVAIVLEFGFTPERSLLAQKALALIFREHFANGCLGPSVPVLADRRNFSLLCPTVEALALIVATRSTVLLPFCEHFVEVYNWLERHQNRGWVSEWSGIGGEPTAFMTVSALAYLSKLETFLDDVLAADAAAMLRVPAFRADHSLADLIYPDELREVITHHIVTPLLDGKNASLASYSMILYGPPGSAKTSIAKRLAFDLNWPLLVLNQSEFLRGGIQNITREADRIFRTAFFLKNAVVLFDEVEELVQARERAEQVGRLLTTAMLPRIHDLRDRRRVVFVFATNRLDGIDQAASRLGRFDIIRCVLPPSAEARRTTLNKLYQKFSVPAEVVSLLEETDVVKETENFGYADLTAFVKSLMVDLHIGQREDVKSVIRQKLIVGMRAVNGEQIADFRKTSGKVDRP